MPSEFGPVVEISVFWDIVMMLLPVVPLSWIPIPLFVPLVVIFVLSDSVIVLEFPSECIPTPLPVAPVITIDAFPDRVVTLLSPLSSIPACVIEIICALSKTVVALLLPVFFMAFLVVVETVPETVILLVLPVVSIASVVVTVMEPVEVTLILSSPSSVFPPFSEVCAEFIVKSLALAALVKANRDARMRATLE